MQAGLPCSCTRVFCTLENLCVTDFYSWCMLSRCIFAYVTWPCRSVFQCRPSHRRLPAPDPGTQLPRPQTAVSVSRYTERDTTHASYSTNCTNRKREIHLSMYKKQQGCSGHCLQSLTVSVSASWFMWTVSLMTGAEENDPENRSSL